MHVRDKTNTNRALKDANHLAIRTILLTNAYNIEGNYEVY